MENVQQIKELQQGFKNNTEVLEGILSDGILAQPLETTLADSKLTSMQRAQILNAHAYLLSTLHFALLKATGDVKRDDNQEKIMFELNRVKSYMGRVQKTLDGGKALSAKEAKAQEDAKRYVTAQLNGASHAPSVSKSHFQGTHVKFDEEPPKVAKKEAAAPKKASHTSKHTHGRVAKPKSQSKKSSRR